MSVIDVRAALVQAHFGLCDALECLDKLKGDSKTEAAESKALRHSVKAINKTIQDLNNKLDVLQEEVDALHS